MPLMNSSNKKEFDTIIQKLDDLQERKINSNYLYDVFVSHSFEEEDKQLAEILRDILKKKDLTAYLAEKEKRYGYIISDKIRDAIRGSRCIVVILTRNSRISASVNQELGYGMGIGKIIIPMVKDEVKDKIGVLLQDVEGELFTNDDFNEKCSLVSDHIFQIPLEEKQITRNSGISDEYLFKQERGDF